MARRFKDKRRKLSQKEWDNIKKLYQSKTATISEIATQYGISRTAIQLKAKQYHWYDLHQEITTAANGKSIVTIAKEEQYIGHDEIYSDDIVIEATSSLIADITLNHHDILKKQRELLNCYVDKLSNSGEEVQIRTLKTATECAKNIIELERKILGMDKQENTVNVNNNAIKISFVGKE